MPNNYNNNTGSLPASPENPRSPAGNASKKLALQEKLNLS